VRPTGAKPGRGAAEADGARFPYLAADRDSRENRLMTLALYDDNMTWEICIDACQGKGQNLAGIE
jgi:hypothetical protein